MSPDQIVIVASYFQNCALAGHLKKKGIFPNWVEIRGYHPSLHSVTLPWEKHSTASVGVFLQQVPRAPWI